MTGFALDLSLKRRPRETQILNNHPSRLIVSPFWSKKLNNRPVLFQEIWFIVGLPHYHFPKQTPQIFLSIYL